MSDNENWVTDESFGYAAPSAPSEESDGNWFTDKAIDTAKGIANLGTTAIDLGALGLSAMANSRLRKNYEDQGLNPDDAPRVDINTDLRNYGYSPTGMNQWFNSHYSKGRQAAEQEVEEAEGFTGKVKAYLTNPDVLVGRGFENLSNLAGLAGISRMAAKAALKEGTAMGLTGDALEKYIQRRATTASAVGEGGLSAAGVSQAIGEDNLENGKGYSENQHYALGAGAAVGLFSPLSNMEARMGAKGILNSIVKREAISTGEPVSLLKTIGGKVGSLGKDIIKEGAIEEGGQNVAEGIFTRLGQGKPWHEGIGEDYGEGLVIGGAMGAAMHSFAGKPKGSVEQAINNSSSQQAAEEAAARPKTELNPEEQSQIAQAATDAQNPNMQVQQPVETQEPTMSPEEAELARMNAEDAARRQAVIDKYGLEFNREHGAAFADVTRNITDEAEKDFHAKILQAAGMMGIKNPFKEKEAAANFATEYKTFGGDLAKLAEFYRNIGIKAENDAGKKQGALRQAEFYQQLADLLEGGELLNFEQRRARKEEKKAAQAAEIQAAQVQQTAEQMKAQEPAPVEAQPEMKTQPKSEAPKLSGVIPSEEEMSDMQYDKTRQYRGEVAAVMSRLEKEGKITPEQKDKIFGLFNRNPRKYKVLDNYKAAMHALKDIENPPPPKEAKSTRKTLTKEAEETWLAQGKLTPEARQILGYTDAEADQLESINKLFTTKEVPAHAKQVNKLNSLIMHGDSRGAKQLAELMTKRAEALHVKEYIESEEMQGSDVDKFNSLVAEERYQEALTMAYKPFSEGGLELSREEINSIDPSRLKKEGESINKGTEEEREGRSAEEDLEKSEENSNEGSVEDTGRVEAEQNGESGSDTIGVAARVKGGTEKAGRAMAAKHSKTVAKKEEDRSKGTVKVTKGEDVKEKLEVIPPKDRSSKVDFSKKLEDADKARSEEMKAAEEADKAAAKAEAKKPEPVVINATIPEIPFEKKEEAPKKTKFGDALKKAFDEAKEKAKTEGESKPIELKSVPKPPKDPFKGVEENKAVVSAVEGKEKDAKAAAKAEMKVRSILESMQDYLDGKRKKRLSENQVDLVNELKDKGFLFVDDEKILDDYNKRIETKFGKSTRHASRSNRTLRSIEDHVRRGVPTSIEKAKGLIREFVNSEGGKNFVNFLMVNDSVAKQVEREIGVDVQGFAFQLRKDDITHIKDHHGNEEVEAARGQRAWKPEDYENLPEVLNSPDKVEIAEYQPKPEAPRVKFEKRLPNGDVLVVEEVLVGRGVLEIVTGYIKTNKAAESHDLTSETPSAPKADVDMPLSDRKRSVSLTPKQRKQNYNDVRNGLNKSWGVSTTKELLDSGKVVICDSNEGFIDTIVKDYLAKGPNLSEEEVRNTLHEEGLDKGTNAIYDENTGKVYINGENVDENEAGSVLAHEIGVHAAKDSEFKGLVKDIEDRVATLMAEGLKSKNPAVKKFWEDVKRRMDDADVSDNEERLAYFLEVYVKRNGVIPQSIQSEMYRAVGQLKDWLLKFLGIKSINEHKAAELLCDVVRAYADQSAMEKGGGRHASKKGKSDKPKKPRKQLTPEEKEKKKQEKLAKMTPSQRASYERQQKRAELNRKIKKQQDERVGKAEMEKTEAAKNEAKAVETGGFKKLIEDTFTGKAAPIGDAILWIGEVGAKLNNKLFKFTDRLVDELSKFAPSAKGYYQKLIDHAKARAEYQAKSAVIYENWQKLKEGDRKAVNQFLFDSTSSGLWGYIPDDWTDMDGKAIPEETFGRVDAHMVKQFEALSPEAQAVVQQVFKYGHDTMILKQKLYDLMGQALQGKNYVSPFKSPKSVLPYSPLRRTGTYNVVWVSPELKESRGKLKALQDKYTSLKENDKDEEQVATRNAKLGVSYAKEAVDKLERSADHYYVGRFEYFTDARQAVRDLKAEYPGNDAVMYEIGTEEGLKSLTSTAEVNEMTANLITAVEKNYGPVSKAMKQSILEMTMDAAQKKVDASMRKRRNIAGANPNMMDSFLHQGQTDSWLLSNMQFGKQISDAFQKVKTETKDYREGPEEGKATVGDMQALYNELQARHQRMMERHNHNAWDTFSEWARTSNTALTLSFKPMFYVQNALQPWMMTAPWLAGQFGGYKTQTTMAKAYGEWGTMFNAAMKDAKTASEKFHAFGNLSKQIEDSKLPLEEKAMLKEMMSRNLLDLGAQQEFGNVTGRSAISKAINKTMVEISVAARGVELLNRYVTAVSGFRLKKAELIGKGKTEAEAVQGATEYAADLLSMTQGDYSALNAPDWFNTRPGKFMLQFRKFQAIQLNFFKQMLKNSFDKNMSREERAAARRQLTWALGTHFAMAGVKGLPAMSATLALLSSMGLLGDDDEDEETALRRHLAEAGVPVEFQDLMLEGLPSFLGWNLSDSVGAGTMLSAAPYRREDLFSKDGFREAIWNLGGAPLGRAERIWKGFFDSNWEHQRPFWEAVLPAGIPSALKAAGIFDPTEDKKTGAKMLNDDEISFGSRALMMLGATPKSVERMYKMRNQAFRTQEYIKEEKGDLTRRWIDAMKNRDYKAQSEIRKELPELNRKRRAKGFKPVSMNDLMTAWKTRQKEEKLMQKNHGLKLPNSQQGFAKQLNKIYN